MAVNCCVSPLAMLGISGVTAIETSAAGLTASVAELVTPPSVAVIVVVPAAKAEARPAELIEATAGFDEAQVTWLVRLVVELSERVPVAVNCCVEPLTTIG